MQKQDYINRITSLLYDFSISDLKAVYTALFKLKENNFHYDNKHVNSPYNRTKP